MIVEIVYENDTHAEIVAQEERYAVRIPGELPGEWETISPEASRDGEKYHPYKSKEPTLEEAKFFMVEYSVKHPETPVRVERRRHMPPRAYDSIIFTPVTSKNNPYRREE